MEYHKIDSIFKRNEGGSFTNEFSNPEFEFLKDNIWEFTEKIDGTNVRIMWDGESLRLGGKTDNAQMPVSLMEKLQQTFTKEKMKEIFPDGKVILYGESFGVKIQSGGKYIKDDMDFILFDVLIDTWWLNRDSIEDIANKLGIKVVKLIGKGTLKNAIEMAKKGFNSEFGDFMAEGIVLRPKTQLFSRKGERIITKVKYKDFLKEKQKAKQKVKIALKRGILKKSSCQNCGEKDVIAHHEDYNKPLKVIWLCRKHHMQLHRDRGAICLDENAKKKISKKLTGRTLSKEHKENISKAMTGKEPSLETKGKISQSLYLFNAHRKRKEQIVS